MAMPIKATPVLKGKEAKEFSARINSNKDRPVSKEASERAVKVYKEMLKAGIRF